MVVVLVVKILVEIVLFVVIELRSLDISNSLLWPIGVGRSEVPVASYS